MKRFYVSSLVGAFLAGTAFLGGCSSSAAPAIHMVGFELRERTDEGVVLAVTLEADNTSDQPLPLREVSYSVYLDGKKVFEGERSAEATILCFGSQRVVLPAAFVPTFSIEGMKHCRVEGQLTYLVPGVLSEALFDADVVRPSTSFVVEGDAELEEKP